MQQPLKIGDHIVFFDGEKHQKRTVTGFDRTGRPVVRWHGALMHTPEWDKIDRIERADKDPAPSVEQRLGR